MKEDMIHHNNSGDKHWKLLHDKRNSVKTYLRSNTSFVVENMKETDRSSTEYNSARTCTGTSRERITSKSRASSCIVILILVILNGVGVAPQETIDKSSRNIGLYPSMVNLAAHADITVNATCGDNGPEDFCKLVEHAQRISRRKRSQCDTCSATSPNPHHRHNIEFAIDGRGDTWWQSPTINNGYAYHWVTIELDLNQVFQVAYIILKAANSPRPGNWVLEKSLDGVQWQPWQYFAVTSSDCRRQYPVRTTRTGSPKFRYDNEVVCTSYFSQLLPLQNGEIHISMINGRPTAENPSLSLIEFTSARYIRFRFQKIRTLHGDLMTIGSNSADQVDPSVTRRYFYSVKDISIGGMCICFGHAHDCPSDPASSKFICKCEHHTEGSNCERCHPKFNQYKWKPGTDGFQCEECNCYGYADSCYYDEGVEHRGESINMKGLRSGGGVCIGCRNNTAGINCDSCVDGFYRPQNVRPGDANSCRACVCDPFGGRTNVGGKYMCRKTANDGGANRGMHPGDCYCNNGYAGSKCDRCDFGFRGYPNCEPCPCSVTGSLNADPCEDTCVCKENTIGIRCDQCKPGYFNLKSNSATGCDECYCSDVTNICESAHLFRSTVHTMKGWTIEDRSGAHQTTPQYDSDLDEPYATHREIAQVVCTGLYYWNAPEDYLGNKLSSYGGELRYSIYYKLNPGFASSPVQEVDVIMEGKAISLEFSNAKDIQPFEIVSFIVPMETGAGWLESNSRLPASKSEILDVLSDVRRLLIRTSYNQNADSEFRIQDVSMDIATPDGYGDSVSAVERCRCPNGYVGFSCQQCAKGYYRKGSACVECLCNGHSDTCNLYTGVCEECGENTMGIHCEFCKSGFYGDATKGTSLDCQSCSCPLTNPSNNFSPTCVVDELDDVMHCLNCPIGYEGRQCQRCSEGYYGDPTELGSRCLPCSCNGNSATCDRRTGVCISCQGHTGGPDCERCIPGYYGNAVQNHYCSPCTCDIDGSIPRKCDPVTGQCTCRPGLTGRKCDRCQDGQYFDRTRKACVSCDCNQQGSVSRLCSNTGACTCKEGVTGTKCNRCDRGYFDFGEDGCRPCNCQHTNQHCNSMTGACVCPPHTTGPGCAQCTPNSFGWSQDTGCKECDCNSVGSTSSQCNITTGDCRCKPQYQGQQCDACSDGFYDFPDCQTCSCHLPGTEATSCHADTGICTCINTGQCRCKINVVAIKCDRCAEGTFSLDSGNSKGCTECFCFGITDQCSQAEYHWGDTVSLRANTQVMVANQINTRSTNEGVVMSENKGLLVTMDTATVRRTMRYEPYYWRLPEQFNGDKLTSYGGQLRFTIYYAAAMESSMDDGEVNVVIRGRHKATTIAYRLDDPPNKMDTDYTVTMREMGWTHLNTRMPVSREEFALVLSDIEFFLIKASYGELMDQSRLSNVFLDVAVEGSGGRGDSTSSGPPALGIEVCECPPGYTGLSCQYCVPGYMRIRGGLYLGECRPCACNGKSDLCDVNTGKCVGCRDNFVGDHCDRCSPGYYLTSDRNGPTCRKCACPLPGIQNNFSPTCRPAGSDGLDQYICDKCPVGYEGIHCERCSAGFYGDPEIPNGYCMKCGCNPSGSTSTKCDRRTGKCSCKPGITGRVCDQCRPRHAITEDGCIPCDDECSGKLLEEMEDLIERTRSVDLENLFPPPWDDLMKAENKTRELSPYLQILVHRKRNYEAARCLHIKDQLDKHLTNNMDSMMVVIKIPPEIKNLENKMDLLTEESKMCYLGGEDVSYVMNRTQNKLMKYAEKLRKVEEEATGLSSRMRRLLDRLLDGTVVDDTELIAGISDLITQLRNRNMSLYQDIADEELRLANELLSRVTEQFSDKVRDVANRYNETNRQIASQLYRAMEKMEDLIQKALGARTIVGKTHKLNDMNNVTIRQLKADFEKLENEIAMVRSILDNAQKIVNDTRLSMDEVKDQIESLAIRAEKLKELMREQLQPESDKVIAARTLLDSSRMLVLRAVNHMRKLKELSDYFQEVNRNVSKLSFDKTDAATRYSRIADVMNEANQTAFNALRLSMEAVDLAKGNLSDLAAEALSKSMDLVTDVANMKETAKRERQNLRNLKNQARASNSSLSDIKKKFRNVKRRVGNLDTTLNPDPKDIKNTSQQALKIANEVLDGVKDLADKGKDLKSFIREATQYAQTINTIKGNLGSVPILLAQANSKIGDLKEKKMRVELRSDAVRRRIDDVRKQIEESRKKAASVRQASVRSEGECTMRYQPKMTPGRVTEVVLQVMVENPDNALFYLGRENGDYILIETRNGQVRVTWDLGSGNGVVNNPVNVVKDPLLPDDWYRIEISRQDDLLNATVFRMSDEEGKNQTVSGSSPGDSIILNVDETDYLYIGGVDDTIKIPVDVPTRSFVGCMGEAYLQDKLVGLWNFRQVSDPSHCTGCLASPMPKSAPSSVFSYDGTSYSILQHSMSRSPSEVTVLDFEFKTFSSNALLLYEGSSTNNDFASVELEDGKLIARIDLGNGIHIMKTTKRYNVGKWVKAFFRRLDGKVRLTTRVESAPELDDVVPLLINGSDNNLNFTSTDLTCVGGCPPEIVLTAPVQKIGFVGCIRDMKIYAQPQPLAGSVIRYSGVRTTCAAEVSRNIGIDEGGYVELPGYSLPADGSVSITFNTREPDALLLLATDDVTSRRRRRRLTGKNYYSLSLSGGYIEARLRTATGSQLVLKSNAHSYSDGDEHLAVLKNKNGAVFLEIDDGMDVVNGNLRNQDDFSIKTSQFFVGGLPEAFPMKDMAASDTSLNGCVRELITDSIVNFNEAKDTRNSFFGTCVYTQTAVSTFPPPRRSTSTKRSTTTMSPPIDPIITTISTLPFTPETLTGCKDANDLNNLRGPSVHFGQSLYSNIQFAFGDEIDAKFRMEIELRTFAEHGLLLFATHDMHPDFFSLQLKNGKPVFRFDSGKGAGETAGNVSINDGQWHTIRISRSKRKGYIKVDDMRYDMVKSPRGNNRMDVTNVLYVGGVSASTDISKIAGAWQSPDCCVRRVSLNKKVLNIRKPSSSNKVEQCYENIESGAYFDGSGYAIYNDEYRVGPVMSIELEFRTWARDGVLVSVSSTRHDGLALEIVNGSIFFRVNNGAGNFFTEYTPKKQLPGIALCDGQWHKIKANKQKNILTLTVDGQVRTDPQISPGNQNSADTKDPLYIGGYPDDAHDQGQLVTNLKFKGCMRKVKLKGQTVDFSRIYEYHDIHPNSCPFNKG